MDFQTLNRRELQALCKLNKIPANVTNIAMVDALKSLETVEGIEEFLNPSRSETSGMSIESPERNEVTSPRVPRTSCRTSTRPKAKKAEAESLHATVSRATSRGVRRQLGGEVNEVPKTPLISSTIKKAVATFSCQDVTTHSNENEDAMKKESTTVQRAYSTRRSTRLTAKKSEAPCEMEKERSEPVKINSFSDELNVSSESDLGKPIEEKHDVVLEESDEILKTEKFVVDLDTTTLENGEEKVLEQLEKVDLEDEKPDSEEKQMVIDENIDTNGSSFNTENPNDISLLEHEHENMAYAVSVKKNEDSECNESSKLDHYNHIDEEENITENKVDVEEAEESLMAVDNLEQLNKEGNGDEVTDEVSDNKENEEIMNENEGSGNEKASKSLNETSLRQLKKQLKALTIKNMDASCVTATEMEN